MLHTFDSELEKLNGYETDFVKILYYDLPKNYSGTYQSYGYSRICTILEGEKHISVRNKEFTYDQNKALLLPSHSKVHMTIEKPTKALVFELSDDLIQTVVKNANFQDTLPSIAQPLNEILISDQERNIKEDIQQLIHIGSKEEERERFLIDLYAQKLVYHLLHFKQTGSLIMTQTVNPMQRAIDYMEKHVHDPILISSVAKVLGMSESSFSHAFKKQMGVTPQKYLKKVKINRAVTLLSEKSVTDTAFELGYENPSHFIRIFKEEFGLTPKQFQLNRVQCSKHILYI
jgi:AraC-like DNA-binding protein